MTDYSFHLARMLRDVDEATRAFAARDWQRAADICLRISTAALYSRACAEIQMNMEMRNVSAPGEHIPGY